MNTQERLQIYLKEIEINDKTGKRINAILEINPNAIEEAKKIDEKIKLYSIGNEENFSYYIFDKKQEVFDILNKIFLIDFDIDWVSHCDLGKNKKIDIEKYTDIHESDKNNKLRIDLFYGKNKIYFILICPQDLRIKFNESLFKYAIMPKPIKIKKTKKW